MLPWFREKWRRRFHPTALERKIDRLRACARGRHRALVFQPKGPFCRVTGWRCRECSQEFLHHDGDGGMVPDGPNDARRKLRPLEDLQKVCTRYGYENGLPPHVLEAMKEIGLDLE